MYKYIYIERERFAELDYLVEDFYCYSELLLKCCHFPLATQTKLNCVSSLQVCPTFRTFFPQKSLSEEIR